ncbi:MAG: DUF6174 domain-containing protein [Pyrinomonadaceae bacterium]
MKTEKLSLIFFLFVVIQFAGCASPGQTSSANSAPAIKAEAVCAMPTPDKSIKTSADENFEKDWKNTREAVAAELELNRRRWQENKISNYNFVCGQYAGGLENPAEPAIIKVREGKAISIEAVAKSNAPKLNGYENFDTIDKLFDYARQQLENGKIIRVKYNEKFGYPEITGINFSYAIDDWNSINITKFEVIK